MYVCLLAWLGCLCGVVSSHGCLCGVVSSALLICPSPQSAGAMIHILPLRLGREVLVQRVETRALLVLVVELEGFKTG